MCFELLHTVYKHHKLLPAADHVLSAHGGHVHNIHNTSAMQGLIWGEPELIFKCSLSSAGTTLNVEDDSWIDLHAE